MCRVVDRCSRRMSYIHDINVYILAVDVGAHVANRRSRRMRHTIL